MAASSGAAAAAERLVVLGDPKCPHTLQLGIASVFATQTAVEIAARFTTTELGQHVEASAFGGTKAAATVEATVVRLALPHSPYDMAQGVITAATTAGTDEERAGVPAAVRGRINDGVWFP
jgi:hypothetical protein